MTGFKEVFVYLPMKEKRDNDYCCFMRIKCLFLWLILPYEEGKINNSDRMTENKTCVLVIVVVCVGLSL